MAGKSISWTPERRAAQALRIKKQKPWLKSTGPKTAQGKARISQNACKHARRSAAYREQMGILRVLLRHQRQQLRAFLALPQFIFRPPTQNKIRNMNNKKEDGRNIFTNLYNQDYEYA